jgi:TM2 domain-containing membrane protein YozV
MSDSNSEDNSTSGNEGQALANSAVRFVQAHPEFGIIPLLLVSVPILEPFVPDDSTIGPIIYVALVLVLLPMIYKAARFLTDKALTGFAKVAVKRIFQWIVGIATVLFAILLVPLLGLVPMTDESNGSAFSRLATSVWELVATSEVCEGEDCTEAIEEPEDQAVTSGAAPRPQDDPLISFVENVNEGLNAENQPELVAESYDACIQRAYGEKDAAGIVACADLLEN